MTTTADTSPLQERGVQRRTFERMRVDLNGRLFVPAESRELACAVGNISVGGAAVGCGTLVERGTQVVLYVDGFGRFEGKVVRHDGLTLGIRFDSTALKRERVAEQLNRFQNKSPMESTLRRQQRRPAAGSTHYTRSGGERVPCRVLDLSPSGVNVKTSVHPPLGEYVLIGQMAGRVVRHHEQGVGIEFVGGPAGGSR